MTKKLSVLISIILACLCISFIQCTAYASSTTDAVEPISITTNCTLNTTYTYSGEYFSDLEVKLYKIANVSSDFQYTYTDDFSDCTLSLNGIQSNSEWDVIRSTLEAYIIANSINPYTVEKTDSFGTARFNDLKPGLYFISEVRVTQNGFRYYFSSALTALPTLNVADNTWNYTSNVMPKPDTDHSSDSDDTQYTVIKLWKGNENQVIRPASIEVDILCDGIVVKTITLSEANNWSYSWLSDHDSVWTVIERNVPNGYVMTLEKRNTTFIITNTVPSTPTTPPSDEPSPKTGDTTNVLLYVILMCISGIALVVFGITSKKRK